MFQLAKTRSASLAAAYLLSLSQPTLAQQADNIQNEFTTHKLPNLELIVSESKGYQRKRTESELAKTFAGLKDLGQEIATYKKLIDENTLACDKTFDELNLSFQQAVKLFLQESHTDANLKVSEINKAEQQIRNNIRALGSEFKDFSSLAIKTFDCIRDDGSPPIKIEDKDISLRFSEMYKTAKAYFRMESESNFSFSSFKETANTIIKHNHPETFRHGRIIVTLTVVSFFLFGFADKIQELYTRGKEKFAQVYTDIKVRTNSFRKKIEQENLMISECDTKLYEYAELLKRYAMKKDSLWNKESFPALALDQRSKLSLQEIFENLPNLHKHLLNTIVFVRRCHPKFRVEEFHKARIIPHLGLEEPEKANLQELIQFYKKTLDQAEIALRLKS